jgi:hypothetical protein
VQFFPWPPPVPSAFLILSSFQGGRGTLQDVAKRLERSLGQRGYRELKYYGVGEDGFALVTRLERIDEAAQPLEGNLRWPNYDQLNSIELARAPFSLSTYLTALIQAGNPNHARRYRLFVFVVSPRVIRPDERLDVRVQTVRNWVRLGALSLDSEYAAKPFTRSHKVTALIYEFVCIPPNEAKLEATSPLPGDRHLIASGLHFED